MWQGGSATAVPAPDRFDWFNEAVATALGPMAISADNVADFHAEGAALQLGDVQLSRFSHSPLRSWRTSALIRKGDPEQYQLGLVTRGSMWLSQHGGESGMLSGDLVLWDTSRPFQAGCGKSNVEAFVLQIPKDRMPLPSQGADRLLGERVLGGTGMGAVLAQFLVSLGGNGPDCGPEELLILGNMAMELAASCMTQQLGADTCRQMSAPVRTYALLYRVDAFIEHRLTDPDLTPRAIADHHHISLRHLYDLFETRGEGVAATIRRRRLERCRADLANPDLRRQPVQAIAARWGFTNAPAFTRVFRATYDTTPTEYRAHTLDLAVGSAAVAPTAPRTPAALAERRSPGAR